LASLGGDNVAKREVDAPAERCMFARRHAVLPRRLARAVHEQRSPVSQRIRHLEAVVFVVTQLEVALGAEGDRRDDRLFAVALLVVVRVVGEAVVPLPAPRGEDVTNKTKRQRRAGCAPVSYLFISTVLYSGADGKSACTLSRTRSTAALKGSGVSVMPE